MTHSITELVEKFTRNLAEYKNPRYNETEVRVEFVNPFWELLGWDVNNVSGKSLTYREVIHEDEVRVGSTTKAPDYSFRIGGRRIFFLETKKPSVDLKNDPAPAFQLRRYAYSAKLPISILTDFEEFIVYDTTLKPAITDKPHVGRMLYYTFQEYIENWDFIRTTFSFDEIQRGNLERFIQDKQGKKPRAEIDKDFLNDLDDWRILLARNIALRNPALSERELNYAVQMTIDRLIFLRMSEDRGIEIQYPLQSLLNGERVYPRLVEIYYRADERYNSGLFHFNEKDGVNPDTITPTLAIDDKLMKEIIRNLYYPDCPYEFSVLPVEVLGNAYEQFLGKRISLTAGHHARIEEKPEVRKAGGVYYTPKYIVDYIVKNTVGRLLEGKTPAEVSDLRILDPACGSGSFLLGAFQYLLEWHLDYYQKEYERTQTVPTITERKGKSKKSAGQAIFQGKGGDWFLATAEKKRILLNNLYGVDIDANAVEVTKLSLLLKVLENENSETLQRQLGLWHERALPNLAANIKCGNSLIGPDYYEHQQAGLFDEKEALRINVFDWQKEFAGIFANGGFDAVIGNPPYIGFHGFKDEKQYLIKKYITTKGKFDIYIPFIEKAFNVLKEGGYQSFICPINFTKRDHGYELRKYLLEKITIIEICNFKHKQIFKGATNYTGIFIFQNVCPDKKSVFNYKEDSINDNGIIICQNVLSEKAWIFRKSNMTAIIEKMNFEKSEKLSFLASGISEGIVTGKNDVFILNKNIAVDLGLEVELYKPCVRGKDILRYKINNPNEIVIYPYKISNKKSVPISIDEFQRNKNIFAYLNSKRNDLKNRQYFNKSSKLWFELWCPRNINQFESMKIIVPEISDKNRFALDDNNFYYGDTVCGITIKSEILINIKYLLGLLNSKLVEAYYKNVTVPKVGGFYIYKTMFLKDIPIRMIDFENVSDKSRHDRMVSLVDKMLELHKRLPEVKTPQEKDIIQRQIDATDTQIDRLVYELYGLTEEEVKVVENV